MYKFIPNQPILYWQQLNKEHKTICFTIIPRKFT